LANFLRRLAWASVAAFSTGCTLWARLVGGSVAASFAGAFCTITPLAAFGPFAAALVAATATTA
jgi:hypothetical protein